MSTIYNKFSSYKDADLWVTKYKSFFPTDEDEDKIFLQAIDYYTGSGNPAFNNYLRHNIRIKKEDFLYPFVTRMIDKLPTYQIPDDITVYRYINKKLLNEMCDTYPPKKNSILQDKGFMSTTLLRESILNLKQQKRLNVLLIISVPRGTKGTYVGLLHDSLPEYELLLAPNTKLHIDRKSFCNRCFECTVIK